MIAKRYTSVEGGLQELAIFALLAARFKSDELGRFVRKTIDPEKLALPLMDAIHKLFSALWEAKVSPSLALSPYRSIFSTPPTSAIFFAYYKHTMQVYTTSQYNGDFIYKNARDALLWRDPRRRGRALEEETINAASMESAVVSLTRHLFSNLAAHHRERVLLGDIKPHNIFFNNNELLQPVFGDYGHATYMELSAPTLISARLETIFYPANWINHPLEGRVRQSCIGSEWYRAPEMQRTGIYTAASDAYSLAASIIEVLCGYSKKEGNPLAALQAQCTQLRVFSNLARCTELTKADWHAKHGGMAVVPTRLLNALDALLLQKGSVRDILAQTTDSARQTELASAQVPVAPLEAADVVMADESPAAASTLLPNSGCLMEIGCYLEAGSIWRDWPRLKLQLDQLFVSVAKFKGGLAAGFSCTSRVERASTLMDYWDLWTQVQHPALAKPISKHPLVVCYAYDLELPRELESELLLASAHLRAYGPSGYCTLEQYLPDELRDSKQKNNQQRKRWPGFVLFFAPPVHGIVRTGMHMDGRGWLTSWHWVPPCSNVNMYNRISTRMFHDGRCLDPNVQKVLCMDETGGSTSALSIFKLATEANGAQQPMRILPETSGRVNKSALDESLADQVANLQLEMHSLPSANKDSFVQLRGLAHCYEKLARDPAVPTPPPTAGSTATDADAPPLIGVQCATFRLGHDAASTNANVAELEQGITQFRLRNLALRKQNRSPVSMQVDLPLLMALFLTGLRKPPSTNEQSAMLLLHCQALRPFIQSRVTLELERFKIISSKYPLARLSSEPSSLMPVVHWNCGRCDASALFYRYRQDQQDGKYAELCGECCSALPAPQKNTFAITAYATRFSCPQGLAQMLAAMH